VDWAAARKKVAMPGNLDHPDFNSHLTLQLTALNSLLKQVPGIAEIAEAATDRPEDELLAHEERYWCDLADATGLPFAGLNQRPTLRYFIAAANLFGARTRAGAVRLIARLPGWAANEETAHGVADWLHRLYPPDDDREFWGSLRPDRLAEQQLHSLLDERPDLLESLFRNAALDEARHAVPLLSRAGRQNAELIRQLEELVNLDDLACRAALLPLMQELSPILRRSHANVDISQQDITYPQTPVPTRDGGFPGISFTPFQGPSGPSINREPEG
jgi:hypothetical protein